MGNLDTAQIDNSPSANSYVPEWKRIYIGLSSKANWLGLLALLRKHLLRQAPAYILLLMFMATFHSNYRIGWNFSDSLPGHLFVTHLNEPPVKGGLVTFRMHGFLMYKDGTTFLKIVRGVPGDRVDVKDGHFFVNMTDVGKAKQKTKKGIPLKAGPTGIIPERHYFVSGTNKDSLDSRYAAIGWVPEEDVIGRAYAIF